MQIIPMLAQVASHFTPPAGSLGIEKPEFLLPKRLDAGPESWTLNEISISAIQEIYEKRGAVACIGEQHLTVLLSDFGYESARGMAGMSKVCIGTSGWAYSSWKPDFYPPKTPASKFLSYYATQLNCVEVNYTFRQRPAAKTLQNWSGATPEAFSFAVKAHQRITHLKRLREVEADIEGFYGSVQPLLAAGKLGPVLFQLPPNLKMDIDRLRGLLRYIPADTRAAIEFRNDSWFSDSVFDLMREHDAALCIAESDELKVPEVHTASFAYYRFRKSNYSEAEMGEVASRLAQVAKERDIYAFLKHEETPEGALNARLLLQTLSPLD